MSDSLQLTASSSDLAAALQLSMRAVQHENVDVRIHALTSLRDMMHSQQVHTHCITTTSERNSFLFAIIDPIP